MPRTATGILLAAGLLAFPAGPALAQEAGAGTPPAQAGEAIQADEAAVARPIPTIAIVDIQLLLQQAAASQSLQRQADEQRSRLQKDWAGQEEKVRASEQELARQRQTLSTDAFDEKRREFERQVTETRRLFQERTRALESTFSQAREVLLGTLQQAIQEIAVERGITLVLPRQQVLLLRDPSLDITDPVLRRLNEKLPQVAVTLPPVQR